MAKYEFQSMLKGYNRYQVDDYLDRLNEELDSYKQKLSLYEQRCEQLEEINKDVKEKYQLLLNEVRVREKAAEDIGRLALKEANIIVSTVKAMQMLSFMRHWQVLVRFYWRSASWERKRVKSRQG